MLQGPEGLDEVSDFPQLVAQLLQRGISEYNVEKIIGLNVLRVLQQVEDSAFQAQTMDTRDYLCDDIKPMWTAEQRKILNVQGAKRCLPVEMR